MQKLLPVMKFSGEFIIIQQDTEHVRQSTSLNGRRPH